MQRKTDLVRAVHNRIETSETPIGEKRNLKIL